MSYFKYTKLASVWLFYLPLAIFAIGYMISEIIRTYFSITDLFLYLALGFFANFAHKYAIKNIVTYKFRFGLGKVPFAYIVPSATIVFAFALLVTAPQVLELNANIIEQSPNESNSQDIKNVIGTTDDVGASIQQAIESDEGGEEKEDLTPVFLLDLTSETPASEQFYSFLQELISKLQPNVVFEGQERQYYHDFGMRFSQLVRDKDWAGVDNLLEELSSKNPDSLDMFVNLLVMRNAPFDVIENYLAQGGQIMPTSLLSKLQQKKFDELDKFENYGVTLASEALGKMNVLDLALLSPLSPESFDYSMKKIVDAGEYKTMVGADTLGIALMNADKNPTLIPYFVQQLLRNNAEVTEQHFLILKKMKADNPRIYEELILSVPEFGNL
jgi:hypothetical protein